MQFVACDLVSIEICYNSFGLELGEVCNNNIIWLSKGLWSFIFYDSVLLSSEVFVNIF